MTAVPASDRLSALELDFLIAVATFVGYEAGVVDGVGDVGGDVVTAAGVGLVRHFGGRVV